MIKIGITGSIASGKTTASKILSLKRGPLYSADEVVKKLYKRRDFQRIIYKKLNLKSKKNFKKEIIQKILDQKKTLKKLENIIHPIARREMLKFTLRNKTKSLLFFEIPLLIEKRLNKYFDIVIFVKSREDLRLKRYLSKGGDQRLFKVLNKHQFKDEKKIKLSDYIVVNNSSLKVLKKKLINIISQYE